MRRGVSFWKSMDKAIAEVGLTVEEMTEVLLIVRKAAYGEEWCRNKAAWAFKSYQKKEGYFLDEFQVLHFHLDPYTNRGFMTPPGEQ